MRCHGKEKGEGAKQRFEGGGGERDVSGTVWGNTYKDPEMKHSRMHWRREFPLSEKGRGQGNEMGLAVSSVQFEEENHGLKGSATICL